MATDPEIDAKIADLATPPPLPVRKHDRLARVIGSVSLALGLALSVAVVVLVVHASNQSACINDTNGARAQPNNADRMAIDQTFKDFGAALATPGAGTLLQIESAIARYETQRAADDKARAANPTGKC